MLKFARDMKKLPDDYKIPSKAWSLLSQEARDAFIAERNKITGNNDTKNNSSIPKQYGGAGHDDTRRTNAVTTIDPDKEDEDTDSSGDSDTEQLVQLFKSYKASCNSSHFIGMARTVIANRTVHVNMDPTKIRALTSRLAYNDAIVIADGGCDTGLLGSGWYIHEYTGRYANVVGFDEFVAKKSGLPIVVGITKVALPDNKGSILLRHNEGVYNQGSRTTLFSEFQLRTRGCIVDSTFKGHRGANRQPGTQRIETPDDEGDDSYTIPLRLTAALMTFRITMPTEEDLNTLPVVDITPDGVWVPSDYNEHDHGLSFADSSFNPPCLAQNVTRNLTTTCAHTTGQTHETEFLSPNPSSSLPGVSVYTAPSEPTSDASMLPYFRVTPTSKTFPTQDSYMSPTLPTTTPDTDDVFHDAHTGDDDASFHETTSYLLPNEGHFFDPSDSLQTHSFIG